MNDTESHYAADYAHLDQQLDSAARMLADNLRTGYTTGYEHELADEVLFRIGDDEHQQRALEQLAHDKAMHEMLDLLDETEASSYDATKAIAEILLAAIAAQNGQGIALRHLVLDEIHRRKDMLLYTVPAA